MRLAIIGAGPMGLEAALGAVARGFEVQVLEKGQAGDSLRQWGSIRFFTPLAMNVSARARALLGPAFPPESALLTGPAFVDAVLLPLAQSAPLRGRIRTGCAVKAVGRKGMARTDFPGHSLRGEKPFRLLLESASGEETLEADAVLDASGAFAFPAWCGAGGPARGEAALADRLVRRLGDLERRAGSWAGKRLLLVGHGHSAAHALLFLEKLAARHSGTQVTWVIRSRNRRPCVETADDPLPERAAVAGRANDLAESPPAFLRVERNATLESLAAEGGRLRAAFSRGEAGVFDEVLSFTGYRPDLSHLAELPLDLAPATEGSRRLHQALCGATDCLSVPSVSPSDLSSGEPGFFLVGAKSYGRSKTFLLRDGLRHLEMILDSLAARRN